MFDNPKSNASPPAHSHAGVVPESRTRDRSAVGSRSIRESAGELRSMTSADTYVSGHFIRRRADAITVAFGLIVVLGGMLAVRNGSVTGFEKSVFRAANDLPQALYPVLWPFQQLGTIVVGPIAAIIAALFRKFRLAAALSIATVAKLGLER